jgi:hypothetical protein
MRTPLNTAVIYGSARRCRHGIKAARNGHVQEVMDRAGPQAVKDLWRAGLPMALAGRLATVFSTLSPDNRGLVAVATLALGLSTHFPGAPGVCIPYESR